MSLDHFLDRSETQRQITNILESFDSNRDNIHFKRGIYIYGASGSGKTHFITDILKRMDYDIIKYDAGDTRNKNLIDSIASNNMSNNNVLNMMYRRKQKIAILMDEIEAMNSGDKWGITSLIKLIRQKKTKRQKSENQTFNPIICISNYNVDKKIKELMKVCHVFELKQPTPLQMTRFLTTSNNLTGGQVQQIVDYAEGDLRKMFFIRSWIEKQGFLPPFQKKVFNEDSKRMTQRILETPIALVDHNKYINETDRTIVALLWHENIVDHLQYNIPNHSLLGVLESYHGMLQNICFADYIDRITFQNQIWQFNEMSSLIKTLANNKLFHDSSLNVRPRSPECRFTKILTKYSTEYNNAKFVASLSYKTEMDRKDVICFFQEMRLRGSSTQELEDLEISKLDVKRFYRYLDQSEEGRGSNRMSIQLDEDEEEGEEQEMMDAYL
jgi:hypothetical protein